MEESMVVSPEQGGQSAAPVDVAQPTGGITVSMSDLMSETPAEQGASTEPAAEKPAPVPKKEPEQTHKTRTQEEIDRGVYARVQAAQRKGADEVRRGDEYTIGDQAIKMLMRTKGISREEAVKSIRAEAKQQREKAYKDNPGAMVDDIAEMVQGRRDSEKAKPDASNPGVPSFEDMQGKIVGGLKEAQANGTLPDGFMKTGLTKTFFDRAIRFGVPAALEMSRMDGASSPEPDKAAQRKSEPKPIRTAGEAAQVGHTDYMSPEISSEKFREMRERASRATKNGKKVGF